MWYFAYTANLEYDAAVAADDSEVSKTKTCQHTTKLKSFKPNFKVKRKGRCLSFFTSHVSIWSTNVALFSFASIN